ncbi:MAG: DUF4157 domain-containing protein [Pseudonocardiaceae bacterium]
MTGTRIHASRSRAAAVPEQQPATSVVRAGPFRSPVLADFASVPVHDPAPPRLRLGAPDSPLEREADAAAERIVRGKPPSTLSVSGGPDTVRRSCAQCANGDDEGCCGGKRLTPDVEVLGKSAGPGSTMTPEADMGIRALSGRGAALPTSEQRFFGTHLGHSFANVRVHTDAEAGRAARALGARAFTHGSDVAFAPGEYAPATESGRRLLAHELVHVVQQSGRTQAPVQRDLATPPPAVAPPAQADLTPDQIAAALRFNRALYDAVRTRLIQDLVGTTPTGVWIDDDIRAIAMLQEEYGLTKDGRVGPVTFRFLDEEVRREGIPHTDANCLLAFEVRNFGVTDAGTAGGTRNVSGHFEVHAQFSQTCGCANYEYRQFIRGHAVRRPAGGGAPVNLAPLFTIPGGGLPAAFSEDGDTTAAVVNYGHRANPDEGVGNRYFDAGGAVNQAAGCRYQNIDRPGGPFAFSPGDELDLDINFRGEVQRGGRVVERKFWTAVRGVFR